MKKSKTKLLVICLVALIAGLSFSDLERNDTNHLGGTDAIFKKVAKPNLKYFHKFIRQDGSFYYVETTQAEYEQLALPNPPIPTDAGGTWAGESHSGYRVAIGEYFDEAQGRILINVEGDMLPLDADVLVGNKLNAKGLSQFNLFKTYKEELQANELLQSSFLKPKVAYALDVTQDAQTNGGGADAVTSRTFSHTTGASLSNGMIAIRTMLWDAGGAGDIVSSVTYAGGAATSAGTSKHASGQRRAYLHWRAAPTAGANNVVISTSISTHIGGGAVTMYNAAQTGPEATNTATSNGTSNSISVTTVTAGALLIMSTGNDGGEPNAGANTTELHSDPEGSGLYKSTTVVSPGSNALEISVASGFNCAVLAAFAPPAGASKLIRPGIAR